MPNHSDAARGSGFARTLRSGAVIIGTIITILTIAIIAVLDIQLSSTLIGKTLPPDLLSWALKAMLAGLLVCAWIALSTMIRTSKRSDRFELWLEDIEDRQHATAEELKAQRQAIASFKEALLQVNEVVKGNTTATKNAARGLRQIDHTNARLDSTLTQLGVIDRKLQQMVREFDDTVIVDVEPRQSDPSAALRLKTPGTGRQQRQA